MKFTKVPHLIVLPEPEQWELAGDLVYESDLLDKAKLPITVTVKKGFVTDLSSIPRVFRLLIVKNGRHRLPSIVHDNLCQRRKTFDRALADRIFLEAMKYCEVPRLRRWTMFVAVRVNTTRLRLLKKAI